MKDAELENKISSLQQTIRSWAEKHELWHDVGFTTFDEHFDVKPWKPPCVLVLWLDGLLCEILNGYIGDEDLIDEFDTLIDQTEFHYEFHDHVTIVFSPRDDALSEQYQRYFDFRWICKLVTPDFAGIYQELFDHFAKHPEDLHHLESRGFEYLLESIFRNHGYRTEIGPGWSDGGIDIRLYQSDAIGEIVTLVQAKRYKQKRAIRLEAVAALKALVDDEKANRGLFVTTSGFLPSTQKFAQRQNRRIELASSADVSKWCKEVNDQLQNTYIEQAAQEILLCLKSGKLSDGMLGKIVHASWGYNMILNDFCLIIKETNKAVLLLQLKKTSVSDDGYGQSGYEIPIIPDEIYIVTNGEPNYIHAKKVERDDSLSFWADNLRSYTIWNGEPEYFDYRD
jgi:Restriction endonuclease